MILFLVPNFGVFKKVKLAMVVYIINISWMKNTNFILEIEKYFSADC